MSGGVLFPIILVPSSNPREILTLCTFLMVFAYITVALRFWTRMFILRTIGWDDMFILFSLVSFSGYCLCLIINSFHIANKNAFTGDQMTMATNIMLALETLYIVAMALFKISLGLFFLRVLIDPILRRIIYGILIIYNIWSVGYLFFALFQCGVPKGDRFWENKLSNKCGSDALGLGMGYAHAVLSAATDIIFVALPLPVIFKAKMQTREKWIITGIFGLAIIGCVASLIRIKYVPVLIEKDTAFWKNSLTLVVWTSIEPGLGIIACSIVTLRPLLRKVSQTIHSRRSTVKESPDASKQSKSYTDSSGTILNDTEVSQPSKPQMSTSDGNTFLLISTDQDQEQPFPISNAYDDATSGPTSSHLRSYPQSSTSPSALRSPTLFEQQENYEYHTSQNKTYHQSRPTNQVIPDIEQPYPVVTRFRPNVSSSNNGETAYTERNGNQMNTDRTIWIE